jgi:hypothetical protein
MSSCVNWAFFGTSEPFQKASETIVLKAPILFDYCVTYILSINKDTFMDLNSLLIICTVDNTILKPRGILLFRCFVIF